MKLCKECKYYKFSILSPFGGEYARCSRNDAENISPVTGKLDKSRRGHCSIQRDYEHLCGPEAKHFEPK